MNFLKRFSVALVLFAFVSCKKEDAGLPPPVTPPPPVNSTFTNPLLPSGPDPWVTQKDGFYYYMQTRGDKLQLWKTKAMSQLGFASPVTIWNKPATGPNSQSVWAPELHYLDGKWYIYYTAGSGDENISQRLFVLENSSADPTQGTWEDKGQLKDPSADFWAADADIFTYNGKNYLVWSGHANVADLTQRIYIAQLQQPWNLATGRIEISTPTYAWEKIGFPAVNEGPEVIANPKGNLVLVFSASSCFTDDYNMGMSLLKEGGNPLNAADWIKSSNPVFVKNPENGAYGPGHCSFFTSPDKTENWFIYHANSLPNQGCGDVRNPRMQKFTWNSDGTPNFGQPVKINTPIIKPSGE